VKATVLCELWCGLEANVATDKGVSGTASVADNVSECDKTDSRPTELTAGQTKPMLRVMCRSTLRPSNMS